MAVKPDFGSYALDSSSEAGKVIAVATVDNGGSHPGNEATYTLEIDSATGTPAFAYERGGASFGSSTSIAGDLRIGFQSPSGSHYYSPTTWGTELGVNQLTGGSAWLHIFRFDTAFAVNDEVTYYDTNSGVLFTLWCSAAGTLTVEVNGVATNVAISSSTSVFHYVIVNVDWSAPSYTVTYCEYGGSPTTTAPASITRSTGTTVQWTHLQTGFVTSRGSSFPSVTHGLAAWFDDELTAAEIARLTADPMPMIGAQVSTPTVLALGEAPVAVAGAGVGVALQPDVVVAPGEAPLALTAAGVGVAAQPSAVVGLGEAPIAVAAAGVGVALQPGVTVAPGDAALALDAAGVAVGPAASTALSLGLADLTVEPVGVGVSTGAAVAVSLGEALLVLEAAGVSVGPASGASLGLGSALLSLDAAGVGVAPGASTVLALGTPQLTLSPVGVGVDQAVAGALRLGGAGLTLEALGIGVSETGGTILALSPAPLTLEVLGVGLALGTPTLVALGEGPLVLTPGAVRVGPRGLQVFTPGAAPLAFTALGGVYVFVRPLVALQALETMDDKQCHLDSFGIPVIVGGQSYLGIFNNDHELTDFGDEGSTGLSNSDPQLWMLTEEAPGRNETLTVDGTTYLVSTVEPDGTGFVCLSLRVFAV